MKLAELVNHYRAKLDILSDAVLIGEIPEGIDEIPDELKKFLVATVFFTPSGKNTKTQIKPFGYRFR